MSKNTRPYDGWLTRYKINRSLTNYEYEGKLDINVPINLPPMDSGLIKINSVFVEYIERWFFFAWLGRNVWRAFNYNLAVFCFFVWLEYICSSTRPK